MKYKKVKALLLYMAITMAMPTMSYAANETAQTMVNPAGSTEEQSSGEYLLEESGEDATNETLDNENPSEEIIPLEGPLLNLILDKITEEVFGENKDAIMNAVMEKTGAEDVGEAMSEIIDEGDLSAKDADYVMQIFADACMEQLSSDQPILDQAKECYIGLLAGADDSTINAAENFKDAQQAFWEIYVQQVENGESKPEGDPEGGSDNEDPAAAEDGNSELESKKAEAASSLDELLNNLPEAVKKDALEIIETAKKEISAALDIESVEKIFSDAKSKCNSLTEEGSELELEISKALEELDNIDISSLEGEDLDSAKKIIEDAKISISQAVSIEEIGQKVSDAKIAISDLINQNILSKQKQVAKGGLKQYYDSLNLTVPELADAAKAEYENGLKNIDDSTDVNGVNQALENAKNALLNISQGTEEVLEKMKKDAVEEVESIKNKINYDLDVVTKASSIAITSIQSAMDVKTLVSAKNTALEVMNNLKSFSESKSSEYASGMLLALNSTTANSDVSAFLKWLSSEVKTDTYEEAQGKIWDALNSIDSSITEYIDYLYGNLKSQVAAVTDQSEELEGLLSDFKTKAEGKGMIDVYMLYENTYNEINDLIASNPLASAKKDAIKKLDSYLDGVTDSELKSDIQAEIKKAKSKIESAKSESEIDSILKDTDANIKQIKKEYQDKMELEKVKDEAINQLDKLISGVTDQELKSILSDITEAAKSEINRAESEAAVNTILQRAINDVRSATVEYSNNKSLLKKKTEMIQKLENLANGKELNTALNTILSQAKMDIMDAETTERVDTIYRNAVEKFNTAYLQMLRDDYITKLDDLAINAQADEEVMQNIQLVIDKAKQNIQNATNAEVMQNIYSQAEKAIQLLTDNSSNLAKVKSDAIYELENYTSLNTESVKKVISVYSNKINSAQTAAEVTGYLNEAKQLLDRLIEAAQANGEDPSANALYNANTASGSLEKTAEQALAKGGGESTSMVKTGDENGLNIFVSALAGIAGIGIIVWILLKFLRKPKK